MANLAYKVPWLNSSLIYCIVSVHVAAVPGEIPGQTRTNTLLVHFDRTAFTPGLACWLRPIKGRRRGLEGIPSYPCIPLSYTTVDAQPYPSLSSMWSITLTQLSHQVGPINLLKVVECLDVCCLSSGLADDFGLWWSYHTTTLTYLIDAREGNDSCCLQ